MFARNRNRGLRIVRVQEAVHVTADVDPESFTANADGVIDYALNGTSETEQQRGDVLCFFDEEFNTVEVDEVELVDA